jgi:hypothetical protein
MLYMVVNNNASCFSQQYAERKRSSVSADSSTIVADSTKWLRQVLRGIKQIVLDLVLLTAYSTSMREVCLRSFCCLWEMWTKIILPRLRRHPR